MEISSIISFISFVGLLALGVPFWYWCRHVAKKNGAKPTLWGLLGLLLPLVTLVLAALASGVGPRTADQDAASRMIVGYGFGGLLAGGVASLVITHVVTKPVSK
ncbi:MAG TPA: hypothetical protein VJO34_05400 [Methylomirabilota bacterium]|nr:hypothetical protein [Methylomirabilota bacterium]